VRCICRNRSSSFGFFTTFESDFVLERGRFLFGKLKKLPRVTCVGCFVFIGEIFSLSDVLKGGASISSDEACGVIRGEVGGVMSNMRLEEDWVGRDRPYVTGCLSLADPSYLIDIDSPRHVYKAPLQ
jgi:hypothetical protein